MPPGLFRRKSLGYEEASLWFKLLDEDGDGHLDMEELHYRLSALGLPESEIEQVLFTIDVDGDDEVCPASIYKPCEICPMVIWDCSPGVFWRIHQWVRACGAVPLFVIDLRRKHHGDNQG